MRTKSDVQDGQSTNLLRTILGQLLLRELNRESNVLARCGDDVHLHGLERWMLELDGVDSSPWKRDFECPVGTSSCSGSRESYEHSLDRVPVGATDNAAQCSARLELDRYRGAPGTVRRMNGSGFGEVTSSGNVNLQFITGEPTETKAPPSI
jgi:hypothetical protein